MRKGRVEHLDACVRSKAQAQNEQDDGAPWGASRLRRAIRSCGFQSFLVAVLALSLGACSAKKDDDKKDDIYSGWQETSVAVDERDLPSDLQEGSSLDQYRRGTLGAGPQGPLDDVYFDYDSSSLSLDARELLDLNADWLRANPGIRIEIEGHCDSRGTIEYNLGLGARRATAVREYLISVGIAADRMSTISYGKELPICGEETPACWARNRRAHLAVLS